MNIPQNKKTELEIEKFILSQIKTLSDGSKERIFSRNQRNESGVFTYNCHLCGVATLPERALQTHTMGKKHQRKLLVDYIPDAAQFRAPLMPKTTNPIKMIYEGEPLPPGQEEEFVPISQLENECIKQRKATIGLEYVIELIDNKLKEPFYVCSLCDKRCDPRNIISQITSHRHRLKYLELHFPEVYKKLQQHKKFNDDMTYREEILSNISDKIEKKFGRKKPFICEYSEYEKNKVEIHHQLTLKDHFTQEDWPNSTKVLLETLTANDDYDSFSSDDGSFVDDRSFHISKKSSGITRRPMFSTKALEKPSVKKDYIKEMKKFLTPRELQEESNRKMEEKYTLEKYKTMVEIAVNELEKELKQHEKNPEKHPKYSEEWKSFWSRRYKQLTLQGKNANDHDYKPEWISYWMERMKELHKKEVEKVKADKAKKLGLTPEAVKNVEFKFKRSQSRSRSRTRSPLSLKHRMRSESPIKISDDSDDDDDRRLASKRARRDRPSRFDDSSAYSRKSEHRSREAYEGYYSSQRRSKSPIEEGPVSLISVCRFLSALESELGLLAHQVLDLLTESVRVEKLKPNSADDLLFDIKNSTMLETVGQKLKGMLNANILEPNKVTPVERAIQNIATLLHEVAKRKPTGYLKPAATFEEGNSSLSPDEAARIEIAKLITQNLIEQGLENVGADVIEEMIDSFMNANKASEPEVKEVKKPEPIKPEPMPSTSKIAVTKNNKSSGSASGLENLSDDELQILLRNFADLTSDEQSHLIAYLSKIEKDDPERVERLKKYVNLGDEESAKNFDVDEEVRSPKNSPAQVYKVELSDDEYDDDDEKHDLVKKLSETSVSVPRGISKSNATALQDKSGVANDLMSSLMQSSTRPQQNWEIRNSSQMQQQNFYPSSEMPQHMVGNDFNGYQQPQMAVTFAQSAPWPQSAASNFHQEAQLSNELFSNKRNNQDDGQERGRYEGSSNNLHLTGKKNKKNH